MAYVLLIIAAIVVLIGVTKLQRTEPHGTPWGALLVWALLLGAGASIWLLSARIH